MVIVGTVVSCRHAGCWCCLAVILALSLADCRAVGMVEVYSGERDQ